MKKNLVGIVKSSTFALVFREKSVRGVAQLASALAWGARGRKFESSRPDKIRKVLHNEEPFLVRWNVLL